jgi:hypothetical protein
MFISRNICKIVNIIKFVIDSATRNFQPCLHLSSLLSKLAH